MSRGSATFAVVAALLAAVARAGPWVSERIDLYTSGVGYPCYRLPVLIAVGANGAHTTPYTTILAFAQGRNISDPTKCSGSDDGTIQRIVLRRQLGDDPLELSAFGAEQVLMEGDIDFFAAVHDYVANTTWVFVQRRPSDVLVGFSRDLGATWSPFAKTEIQMPKGITQVKPGTGHGIQIEATGRLVVPFVCNGDHSCLLLSDDHGASWYIPAGTVGPKGTREPHVVPTGVADNEYYVSMRNMGTGDFPAGHRAVSWSHDDCTSLGEVTIDQNLQEPVTPDWIGIVGGLTRMGAEMLWTAPLQEKERADLAARLSADGGREWWDAEDAVMVFKGPASYSDAQEIAGNVGGILFENGDKTFADRISLALLYRRC